VLRMLYRALHCCHAHIVNVFAFNCHAGSSQMLLIYRLLAFLWCSAVAVIQFADKGFFVLKYYTVW